MKSSEAQRTGQRQSFNVEILDEDGLWKQLGDKPSELNPKSSNFRTTAIHWNRVAAYGIGVLFTAVLHSLLLGSLLLGTEGRPKRTPLREGSAATQNKEASEFVSMLILLNNSSITPPDQESTESAYTAASREAEQTAAQTILLTAADKAPPPQPNASFDGTDEQSPTAEATGNEAGRALIFGRYMGQIKARIQRAWEYPAESPQTSFQCQVQIKQNKKGEVMEVTLQRCGEDPDWQLSLAQAIQRASPLSAPPDESVFTEVVTLSMEAQRIESPVGDQDIYASLAVPADNSSIDSNQLATRRHGRSGQRAGDEKKFDRRDGK